MIPITDYFQIGFYLLCLILLTHPLGIFLAAVFEGRPTILSKPLGWMETVIYKLAGVDKTQEMNWQQYLWALLAFNILGFLALFGLQLFQHFLPCNPNHLAGVDLFLAFNTAVSFVTNTNWQAYAGETTMSYLTQMAGLAVQNFLSAASGVAVFLVLVRGLKNRCNSALGNFWVDMTRVTIYILLPLSILLSIGLIAEGVVQNFHTNQIVTTLEGRSQTIPQGPAASQIAIKQLGTNGGGFFNANSAHPYENPTPVSNFLEMLAILLLPSALVFAYGVLIKSRRQALLIFGIMLMFLVVAISVSTYAEYHTGKALGVTLLEGKETRFGIVNSIIWSNVTTLASNGSVNAMHSSLSPLAGGVALFNMMLGEIIFGGFGSGMYGMILFIMLTVFLAGLMAGRTPEYLGKKIEKQEILLVMVGILLPSIVVLIGTSIAVVAPAGLSSLLNHGPHGFSEILYAFTSAANNNGSAFAGLNANTPFYNLFLGLAMIIGRFGVMIPCLMIAGSLAAKKIVPVSPGTFPTNNFTFAMLLTGVIIIMGGLTFFPALVLGPILDHLLLLTTTVRF